jgi:integrase/recombinase XerC
MCYINDFIKHLKYEKRYSDRTIISYKTDLTQFQEFLSENFNILIHQSKSTHIREWIFFLHEKGISAKSINRKVTSLKTLFKFLIKQSIVKVNPASNIHSIKIEKKLPEIIDEKDLKILFDKILSDVTEDYSLLRDKTILLTFYYTGMRLSELINIKKQDIDFQNLTIKVLGKRNKERYIPITKKFAKFLKFYLSQTEKRYNFAQNNYYIFLTDKGKKTYPKFIYRKVNNYLSNITTIHKKSPHILRHTFATHLLNKGADINAIKEILGHANLAATQIYTHNTIEKLKKTYNKTHPRSDS